MSATRMGHTRGRFWWLTLLVLACGISAGCNGSDGGEADDELRFVPFEAPIDIITPLPDATTQEGWWDPSFRASGCVAQWPERARFVWYPDAIGTSSVTSRVASDSGDDQSERTVGFITMRWSDDDQFEQTARRMRRSMELPCFSTGYDKGINAEPVELDGLPDGYRAVRWPETSNQVTVVLFDADSHTVMVVNWQERHGSEYDVPTDELVDVANQAWTEFLANNPPLD